MEAKKARIDPALCLGCGQHPATIFCNGNTSCRKSIGICSVACARLNMPHPGINSVDLSFDCEMHQSFSEKIFWKKKKIVRLCATRTIPCAHCNVLRLQCELGDCFGKCGATNICQNKFWKGCAGKCNACVALQAVQLQKQQRIVLLLKEMDVLGFDGDAVDELVGTFLNKCRDNRSITQEFYDEHIDH